MSNLEIARRQNEYLTALHETALALMNRLDSEELVEAIVVRAAQLLDTAHGCVYLVEPDESSMVLKVGIGHFKAHIGARLNIGQGIAGKIWQTGQPQVLSAYSSWPDSIPQFDRHTFHAAVGVPLTSGERVIGTLGMAHTAEGAVFGDAEVNLLVRFAQLASIALDNARLYATAQRELAERAQTEQQLRAAEARYRTLVERIPGIVYTAEINAQSSLSYISPQIESLLGFTPEEWLADPDAWLKQIHPDDRERVLSDIARTQASAEPVPAEYRALTRDGRTVWLQDARHVVRDEDGRPLFLQGITLDITARKQAEAAQAESEQRFRTLVMHAPVGIFQTDAHGNTIFSNERSQELSGLASSEMSHGAGWSQMLHPDDRERVFAEWQAAIQSTRPLDSEFRFQHADGRIVWVATKIVALHDPQGAVSGYLGIVTDITERKRVEDELAEARDQALEASRIKSEFLATMSHEIRTPMNGIIGMTDLLLDTSLDEVQQEFAGIVHDSAYALLAVINDILDFSKIEAGKVVLHQHDFDLLAVVEGVADLLAGRAYDKKLSLMTFISPDIPTQLYGDAGRLRQVLLNLVGNAVKFTERGEVVLRAELEHMEGATIIVRFTVRDTGIGFSEATGRRLFQPFTQADGSLTRKYGGTGLGLAISRRLVELMGGAISAESAVGEGSTFVFTVRFKRALAAPAMPPALADLTNLRALVVDDSRSHQGIIQDYLRAWGMLADAAASGGAALAALRQAAGAGTPYQLVIADLAMPEMDGFAVGRAIQGDPAIARTPLILLSAFDERGLGDQALGSGFATYLARPVKQSKLFDAIAGALATAHRPAAGKQSQGASAGQERPRALILLVEDHKVNQRLAQRQLEKLGYVVDIVKHGREAVDAITQARRRYALILMDCQMPVMDGFAATRAIRDLERDGRPRTPIIAMTASARQASRSACLAAGMDDYLIKPVRSADLQRILAHWIPEAI